MSAGTLTGALVRWAALAVAAAALAPLAAGSPLLQRPRPKPHWPSRTHRPIPPGTDQGLYNEGFVEGDIVPRPTIKNAIADQNMLWPYATIIYKTDDGIGCPESPQCEILMQAMDHYHQKTCVRFKEWTGERDYVKIFFNPDSGACWSPVGRSGDGEQLLSLGQRCWYLGIVVHELGHAVGFWHEMNRPDRDSWIYIFWNNIIPVFAHAFAKQDAAYVDTLGEQFDYRSIMMYDEYAFSKDGSSPTIRPTQPGVVIGPIWKKTGLSASDVRRVHKLYKCQGNRNKWGFPYDVTCDFNRHVCGFKNGGSSVWNWKNNTRQDGFVYSTCESAGSTPGYFMSVNMHPSPDSARGCVRFWYLLQSNSELVLQLSQAHLDRVTQLSYDPDATRDLWESQETTGKWTRVEVPIDTSRPFKLIFMSSFSESCRRGTIALDDVEIRYRPCMASTGAMAGTPPLEEATPSPTAATAWPTTEATTHDPDALLPPLPPRPAVTQPLPPSHQAQEATAPPDDGGAAPDVPDHPHVAFEADFLPPKQGNEI